ncbi:MAG: outer membrane beta-barrel domain-containing protein [Pseudomonadota bacterium]
METRLRVLLLNLAVAFACSGCAIFGGGKDQAAQGEDGEAPPVLVFEPDVDTRQVREAKIDTENFEIGVFGGIMAIEDFGSNSIVGVRAAYHVTQTFFAEATYGMTEAGRTSFEELSGGAELLLDDDRQLTYYNLSLGLNLLPGEVFMGKKRAFNSSLYLTAGAGSTEFAGDSRFTLSAGLGYRFYVRDWLALHATARGHFFDLDLLGEPKTTTNLEAHGGFTVFF